MRLGSPPVFARSAALLCLALLPAPAALGQRGQQPPTQPPTQPPAREAPAPAGPPPSAAGQPAPGDGAAGQAPGDPEAPPAEPALELPGPIHSLRRAQQRLTQAIESAEPWWARWAGRPGLDSAAGLRAGRSVAIFEADVRQVERSLTLLPPEFLPPRQRFEHAAALACATAWRCWCALAPWSRDPRYWLARLEAALLELPAEPQGPALVAWLKRAKLLPGLVAEARAALREAPAELLPSSRARAQRLAERARRLPAELLDESQSPELRAALREVLAAAEAAVRDFERHLEQDMVPNSIRRSLGTDRFTAWLRAATGSRASLESIELRLERELLAVRERLAALPEPGPPAPPDAERTGRLLAALPGALASLGLADWPVPRLLGAELVASEPGARALHLWPRGGGLMAELRRPDPAWSEARRRARLHELGPAGLSAALLLELWPGGLCLEALAAGTPARQLRGWPDPIGARGAGWLLAGWARERGLFAEGAALGPQVDAALERLWQRELCSLWAALRLHARERPSEALVDELGILVGLEPAEARELLLAVELDPAAGMSALVGLEWLDLWAQRRQAAELPAEARAALAAQLAADPRLRAPLLAGGIQAPPGNADTEARPPSAPAGSKTFGPPGATAPSRPPASRRNRG
jgi:hypothetical protein